MPYNWVRIRSSPPRERRDEVKEICRRNGGRLCENQIYYDENDQAHALVELPAEDAKRQALLQELGATAFIGLVHADEKAGGMRPPPSKQ
jgi:hypothetical protein